MIVPSLDMLANVRVNQWIAHLPEDHPLAQQHWALLSATVTISGLPESWLLLSPELPYLGVWREWDRCKKLRRAVRERFSAHKDLIAQTLLDAAINGAQRALARRICE